MNKKVGIITYHAAHNYGSMLQAYALQQTILRMGFDCEIINFRTKRQREMYTPRFMNEKSIRKIIKYILTLGHIKESYQQYQLFEDFLSTQLALTNKEYTTLEELEQDNFLKFDYTLSGSDQIWNTFCRDFDWAYFLPFVKTGKRIAYAPSMGRQVSVEVGNLYDNQISSHLKYYDILSARERMTAKKIKKITGHLPEVVVDPTLLHPKNKWKELAGDTPLINKEYIFLYMPWFDQETFDLALKYSDRKQLPVFLTLWPNQSRWDIIRLLRKGVQLHCSTGPLEFLNICKYAKIIIAKSFHAVIFSMIFERPFYAVQGISDDRINDLLRKAGILEKHNLDLNNFETIAQDQIPETVNYECAFQALSTEIEHSFSFLENALK